MRIQKHLVIMVRAPRIGRVKTRLAKDIGAIPAWRFYRHAMAETVRRIGRDPRWRCWLSVTPDGDIDALRLWPVGPERIKQGVGGLGPRMMRPMRTLPPGPVVLIGSDIPNVTSDSIAQAFKALGSHQAVFGPATDGGYWLVGFSRSRRVPTDAFDNVRWSTASALADTLKNMAGISVAMTQTMSDVDNGDDYAKWKKTLRRKG
ncbi:MAG: TIGR04282 family arsenosugar biosynthesis glycosyltransferase [Rhodospirillales bacterium]|nr:TIGR04282 family arsenosugar biosynthesis glycosyltransferase [Rhodospirillales bacterium]